MRSGQRFSYLALEPEDPDAFIQKALTLLASDRYLEKGMSLMALTGRRPAGNQDTCEAPTPLLPTLQTSEPDRRYLPRTNRPQILDLTHPLCRAEL
jgi:hypothetical protein